MFNPRTFGFINGNITVLSIIVGLYSAGASKKRDTQCDFSDVNCRSFM